MVNQVSCVPFPGKSFFRTNGSESHVFGLEPNYGCCTANMGQGWPKLAMRAVQKTDEGLVLAHLLPCSVHTDIGGQPVLLRIDSEYPFRLGADITVQAEDADFALSIRIPLWAREVLVNGKPVHPEEGHLKFQKRWHGTETLHLTLSDAPHLVSRPQGMQAAEYGPLVFSLPVQMKAHRREYVRDGVERKFPYCDWTFEPQSEWRFGFASPDLTVEERPLSATPFSMACPPVVLHAQLAPISWEWADGYDSVPSAVPASKQAVGPSRSMELIPYGHAKLRMTELPLAETDNPSQKNEHKEECPVIRGLSHIAVRAADLMKTVHFYTEVLGLPEAFRMTDGQGNVSTVYVYIAQSQFIEIFANGSRPPLSGQDVIGMCHICLETEDVEKAYATVKERGGPLDTDVRLGKSRCRMFWTHDPDGNALEIMELPPDSLQAKANARFASRS